MRELYGGTDQVVSKYLCGLHLFSPVRAGLPDANGESVASNFLAGDLHEEERRLSENERRLSHARSRVHEFGVDDSLERNLHLESVPFRVNEPVKCSPMVQEVCNQVTRGTVGSMCGNAPPSAYGKFGAWYYDGNWTVVQSQN